MRMSFVVSAILTLSIVLFAPVCWAVDTRAIDRIRQKNVLSEEDLGIIEEFVKSAIDELVNTTDFTQVARLREIIVTRQSEQAQYAEQYSMCLRKYIGEAFVKTDKLEDAARRHRVRVNLMILVAELENPRLVNIALDALNDRDESVRYWVVRALTSRGFIEKIEAEPGSLDVVKNIASKFEGIVETAAPEVLRIMAEIVLVANNEQADSLLMKIADVRIDRYADWTAKAGPIDIEVLELLCDKLIVKTKKADEYGRRFAQLYSYTMQKYILFLRGEVSLDEGQKQALASILVEIEDKCIGKLTGLQQTVIRRAIELDDANTLYQEKIRLLGEAEKQGEIPAKFGFDYGQADDGGRLMQPRELPAPPTIEQ
jgi:hypothetical protein